MRTMSVEGLNSTSSSTSTWHQPEHSNIPAEPNLSETKSADLDYYEVLVGLTSSDFVHRLIRTYADLEATKGIHLPQLPPHYWEHVASRIRLENEGVTQFEGGPLDLEGINYQDAWMFPVEVHDEEGSSIFQVTALNCNYGTDLSTAKVVFSFVDEDNLKLRNYSDQETLDFSTALKTTEPTIVIRVAYTANIAFPIMTTPLDVPSPEVFRTRVEKLVQQLGLNFDPSQLDYSQLKQPDLELAEEHEDFVIMEPVVVDSYLGPVTIYRIFTNDVWQYYEIYTFDSAVQISDDLHSTQQKRRARLLRKIMKNSSVFKDKSRNKVARPSPVSWLRQLRDRSGRVVMRADSGCDLCMLYNERGCDCHSQLMSALEKAKNENGIVVLIPTQDGNGYGTATELEVNKYKYGFGGQTLPPRQAGSQLLGEEFVDIRTFDGVTRILKSLGMRQVEVITDNRRKHEQLDSDPLVSVTTRRTGTEEMLTEHQRKFVPDKLDSQQYLQ